MLSHDHFSATETILRVQPESGWQVRCACYFLAAAVEPASQRCRAFRPGVNSRVKFAPLAVLVGRSIAMLLLGAAPANAQVYEGRQLVKATLLADTSAIVSGKRFTVGLLLQMAPV